MSVEVLPFQRLSFTSHNKTSVAPLVASYNKGSGGTIKNTITSTFYFSTLSFILPYRKVNISVCFSLLEVSFKFILATVRVVCRSIIASADCVITSAVISGFSDVETHENTNRESVSVG